MVVNTNLRVRVELDRRRRAVDGDFAGGHETAVRRGEKGGPSIQSVRVIHPSLDFCAAVAPSLTGNEQGNHIPSAG